MLLDNPLAPPGRRPIVAIEEFELMINVNSYACQEMTLNDTLLFIETLVLGP